MLVQHRLFSLELCYAASGLNSTSKQLAWLTKDVFRAVDSLEHYEDLRRRR